MTHLPILRGGQPYRSLDTIELRHIVTGEPVARVSQANSGLIGRDLLAAADRRRALRELPFEELIRICKTAATLFVEADLPVDPVEGKRQSPGDYVEQQSATTGMPQSLCRANMKKIQHVLAEMPTVLGGLTRGLDLSVLDSGWTEQDGRVVAYQGQADTLGAILPSNSPGVHSLWIPSIALKVPVILKPGSQEPWTPIRVLQALIAAGCPHEALGFYPTDHAGAAQILMRCDRSMMFGDESTVRPWANDRRVQLHGPGWSKVLFGDDSAPEWERYLEVLVTSVAENGGRSCLNASGVWLPAHGKEVAMALAERLAKIDARALDDPEAGLCAFSNPAIARAISDRIDSQLAERGAVDLTAEYRSGEPRLAERHGCTFLLPTVIWCEKSDHPLAASEFLFPFVSVVEAPQDEMLERIGPTLVATAITEDAGFQEEAMNARNVDRLNVGAVPTSRVSWDQPHEGNLFEHLYRQRSFQSVDPSKRETPRAASG